MIIKKKNNNNFLVVCHILDWKVFIEYRAYFPADPPCLQITNYQSASTKQASHRINTSLFKRSCRIRPCRLKTNPTAFERSNYVFCLIPAWIEFRFSGSNRGIQFTRAIHSEASNYTCSICRKIMNRMTCKASRFCDWHYRVVEPIWETRDFYVTR